MADVTSAGKLQHVEGESLAMTHGNIWEHLLILGLNQIQEVQHSLSDDWKMVAIRMPVIGADSAPNCNQSHRGNGGLRWKQ